MELGYCYKSKEDNMYRLTIDETLVIALMDKVKDMMRKVDDIPSMYKLSGIWVELDELIKSEDRL